MSSTGLSGGLAIFWKNDVVVDLKSYSMNHIDVWVTEIDGKMWRFTGFYGDPRRARRSESWRLLCFLKNQASHPWLVHIARSGSLQGGSRGKLFRYENMWQRHNLYNDTVVEGWNGGCMNLEDVTVSLGHLQSTLTRRDRDEFGSVKGELKQLRRQLESVRGQTIGAGPVAEERRIMARLAEVLAREEAMEKQRSRVQWLHEGDRNTNFFQAKAKQRTRTNKIWALRRADGSLCESQEELEGLAAGFYRSLFTAQEDTIPKLVTHYIPTRVSELMNVSLATEFSHEEVRKAVFMMHPNKSPGPDGFTVGFYQRH